MDGNSITVETLINGVSFKPVLINTNYKYYSIVDKNLITKLQLPRVKIPPKPITGFIKENTKEPWVEITEIAKLSIDIQGYRRNIFAYMVPALSNPVIIGLPWIKKNNIIIKPTTNTLIINSYNLTISTKITPVSSEIKELTATPFTILVKGARKRQKPLTVFKALLQDITKALRPKITRIPTEIQKLLPAQYHDHLPFSRGIWRRNYRRTALVLITYLHWKKAKTGKKGTRYKAFCMG